MTRVVLCSQEKAIALAAQWHALNNDYEALQAEREHEAVLRESLEAVTLERDALKAVMKKHAGVATPPKTLRASFVRLTLKAASIYCRHPRCDSQITWLRDSTDAPEVLKAAAKAMRRALVEI